MLRAWLSLIFILSSSAFAAGPVCSTEKVKLITETRAPIWKLYPQSKKVFVDEMSKDLVSFYGANTLLFYHNLLKLAPSFGPDYAAAATALGIGPIFGDAHFGNLGSYGEHLAINDVDDVTVAPRIYDLLRANVSLAIHFPKVPQAQSAFIAGYKDGVSSSSFDFFADDNFSSVLVPEKKVEEPDPPKSAWNPAEQALRSMTKLSQGEFDKRCKKFVFAPFHGGSSIGLPRFRVTCDGMTYEVKACIASAVDDAIGNKKTCNGGKSIQELADKLSPKAAKPFTVASALHKVPEFSAFGFYGHVRSEDIPDIDDTNESEVTKISYQFGKVIGEGHARSIKQTGKWNSIFEDQLQKGLAKATYVMLQATSQDFQTIPKCL